MEGKGEVKDLITIGISKGRLLPETCEILSKMGLSVEEIINNTRKLCFEYHHEGLKIVVLRSFDIPTYVEKGVCDIGIAGKDVIMEQGRDVYEPLDLGIGFCRMVLARPKRKNLLIPMGIPRVATKFPSITQKYFIHKGIQVEIIRLYGAVELAPLLGLSDMIVDLVSTGETLRVNDLEEVEEIMKVTGRVIVNRASMKLKSKRIGDILRRMDEAKPVGMVKR